MNRLAISLSAAVASALLGCGVHAGEGDFVSDAREKLTTSSFVYGDYARNGWTYGYWAPTDFDNASPVYSGEKSIAVTFQPSTAVYFTHSG